MRDGRYADGRCTDLATHSHGAIVSGIAGGLYAYHSRYLNPNDFDFQKSIDILIMVVIGGIRSLSGAAVPCANAGDASSSIAIASLVMVSSSAVLIY